MRHALGAIIPHSHRQTLDRLPPINRPASIISGSDLPLNCTNLNESPGQCYLRVFRRVRRCRTRSSTRTVRCGGSPHCGKWMTTWEG